ncbi:hypothetical protein SCOCK_360055 [Actinacidiphila cocklensis]|uniref:Uncharacterized protein n=1 Tax=Actinacidiphila cocklensis TaxID=887465 RepID=A0A9W4GSF2_9ACTN|nr:hypothetical protein SCOCK_360055 [Actinacidiphila cocklensis]
MAAPTPCVTSTLLVNVNAFTNPFTANGTPPSLHWCSPAGVRWKIRALKGAGWSAVPIAT